MADHLRSRDNPTSRPDDGYSSRPQIGAQPPQRSPVSGSDDDNNDRDLEEGKGPEPGAGATGTGAEADAQQQQEGEEEIRVSRLATEFYTVSHLILFSILGTLARLGLQALTFYPGAPIAFSSVWPNFAGSLVMGFLSEDRRLFRHEWGVPRFDRQHQQQQKSAEVAAGVPSPSESEQQLAAELEAAKKAHLATKKTIPLYIGLATGFCGSFTSFSSFVRDAFLATSNDLPSPDLAPASASLPRSGGRSFMALAAVPIATVSLSLSGLRIGAHLAAALGRATPSLPPRLTRRVLDPLAALLAWGCWLGAALLSALPPDRFAAEETWRGSATFALVFAPLGCLLRFYASLRLNPRVASFPLGTFAVNVFGAAVLAMAWDLAHVPLGRVVGCQVLQGVEDGFCGALTTVSTWVAELAGLRRRQADYGGSEME
ncbi:Fluoride export protein [Diatrype stigma]|uniref:Fluoride export protein n=1 Tax=Diatrype stigma TaxID=117547 RepID=A0AAN9YRN1_9PEZI